jgi:hypothetical protein
LLGITATRADAIQAKFLTVVMNRAKLPPPDDDLDRSTTHRAFVSIALAGRSTVAPSARQAHDPPR